MQEAPILTPEACRAGRAILRWTAAELAENAGVSTGLISKVEHGGPIRTDVSRRIVSAFRKAGVELAGDGGTAISWTSRRRL